MPIPAHIRKQFYGKEWRTVTRPRILERAVDRCEQCKAPNHTVIVRHAEYPGWWFSLDGQGHRPNGKEAAAKVRTMGGAVEIVLTIAHLNHKPGDDRDENLKAMCQRCHLTYDRGQHHLTRATRKDAQRPLLNPTVNERTSDPNQQPASIQTPNNPRDAA
jgi:hypothetical protein